MKKLAALLSTFIMVVWFAPLSGFAASIPSKPAAGVIKQMGTVKAAFLNVRSEPNTSSKVIGKLKQGTRTEIIGKTGNWYRVKYGSMQGYVNGAYIAMSLLPAPESKPVSPSPALIKQWGTVKVTPLNVRTAPNTTAAIVSKLKQRDKVALLSKSGAWYKISFGKVTGYVNGYYLDVPPSNNKTSPSPEPQSNPSPSTLPPVKIPAPIPAPVQTPGPVSDKLYTIVIDAGHGGNDQGATGTHQNKEKDLTLVIATRLESELNKNEHFNVVMTRTSSLDEKLTEEKRKQELSEKVSIANKVHADVFLSIHINSGPPTAHGTEAFYTTPQSKEFAQIVYKHLLQATQFTDRGLRTRGLYVTKNTTMPSTLVEIGFLSNQTENDKMLDPSFQDHLAQELADGITEYYSEHSK